MQSFALTAASAPPIAVRGVCHRCWTTATAPYGPLPSFARRTDTDQSRLGARQLNANSFTLMVWVDTAVHPNLPGGEKSIGKPES